MSIVIEDKAYCKIMLHILKHVSNDCYGMLIGKSVNNEVIITDVIPFSHDKIFAPQLEIALKFVSNILINIRLRFIFLKITQ